MARLNTRRSSFPASRSLSSPPSSSQSDQENNDPSEAPRRDKGKQRATDMPPSRNRSLPTPSTEGSDGSRGQKRKRPQLTQPSDIPDELDENDAKYNRYFDPDQNPEARRQVKRKSRALHRDFHENRDELLKDDCDGLRQTVLQANNVFRNIKQTNDATVDSRLFVDVSKLALKKTQEAVRGDTSSGLDIDDFLNKCLSFMKNGGQADAEDQPQTQTQRRRTQLDEDDLDEDEPDHTQFDWELLGQHACFPYNARPACPSFLLGPLSVEKKVRKQTQRSARQTKDTNAKEARPEALTKDDLSQSDQNSLSAICGNIKKHLSAHIQKEAKAMERKFSSEAELATEAGKYWLRRHRITRYGGPVLFDYVINPRSFGQTVENMFYISFLIKEGYAGIASDDDGMPVLTEAEPMDVNQKRAQNIQRHQAVFSLDYSTWQKLIQAFDITESMIAHRDEGEQIQVGSRGWYS
ncbi:Non-structural maintenance of chromosomes element 4 A [Lecanosticta acicola]|uniref:Non-structural maintenance of chromosomes element 4 n=1 Tax=Lecanosticta acicola TaxID=111012 RepID=A0AAI8Z5N4_9PEZI|nr:Non-structural maintenance of chromosomes element 4 A [Lecanosticta acicola]